ncbi:small acid-soluble spore protein P [Paenibacillus chungangensis]|uniref:Small acid-soluble spore protein P n=1 Tax=Paenibacillus chungangensis TaxID=696535 RepID=A0ABW3HJW3_9BACL
MAKSESIPVPESIPHNERNRKDKSGGAMQEPMSGSKKTKQKNHVSHHNPEG